jgi:predicted phage tail protein
LEAAARGTQVLLTWIPSASSPLDVYAGTTQDFCGAVQVNVCSTTSQSALTGDLANGTTYYFWLVDSKSNAVSNMAQATTSGAAPAAPAGLTRAPGNGQVILSRAAPSSLLGICSPGPPTGLSADPGNGQVGLSWAAPASDGGSPVTGYNVYQGTSPGQETGTPVNGSPVTATSYPVTGLANGITYYFTVVAVNAAGPSPPSNEVSAVPVTVPGAPAGLSAAPGNGQVALSWAAPASDGGSPVTGYNVYQGTSPGQETGAPVNGSPVTATSYPVTGLVNGITYYFKVTAVNQVGEGPGAEAKAVPVTVPGAPAGLAATPGNGQVALSWTAPASDGGSPVTGYDLYVGTTADFSGGAPLATVTSTAIRVTRLVNGTTYYFKVTAVNQVGEGPGAEAKVIPVTVPGAPGGLAAVAGNGQVTLSWAAPASDGGSPVTGYDLYVGTTADFSGGAPLATVTGTVVAVTGLVNGTTYYFKVTAVNQVGEGPGAEAKVIPVTVPGAPGGLAAVAGNGQVTLSWAAPASDGGSPVTGYLIYRGTSPGGETGTPVNGSPVTPTSDTVTGLTNGTTYYFTVVAINAAGLSPPSDEASAALPPIGPTTPPPTTGPPTTPPPNTAPPFAAPTRLTATADDTKVSLSWTAPASDGGSSVISYKVYVATVPGVQGAVASGSITGTDTTVTGLTDDTVYYFMVSAVNATGDESPLSTEVSAEPVEARVASVHLPSPTVPTQLIALLAAVAAMAAAGIFTLITRRRRIRSPARSGRQMAVAPDLRVVPDTSRPDALGVHNTGQEPTHTVRLEPRPGATTTTIKEGRP